jgi:alpha-galactosidase
MIQTTFRTVASHLASILLAFSLLAGIAGCKPPAKPGTADQSEPPQNPEPPSAAGHLAGVSDVPASREWEKTFWNAEDPARWPVSFVMNGTASRDLLPAWTAAPVEEKNLDGKIVRILRRQDPASGLELRVEVVSYSAWPVVEWTAFLENKGQGDSPELRSLQAADVFFPGSDFKLHGIQGDSNTANSFAPYEWVAQPGTARVFSSGKTGKSTHGPDGWPYFNLAGPGDQGRILVLGWPGDWRATFIPENDGLRWFAGQERTGFQLRPGETARFPSVTLMFWKGGDWIMAQNLWRRWYRDEVMPHPEGGRQGPMWNEQTTLHESQIPRFQKLLEAGIQPDLCWMDAGDGWWVKPEPLPYAKTPLAALVFLNTTGFWDPDPVKFPKGFAPFTDWARQHGMKSLLWFEPERIGYTNSVPGAYDRPVLATEHPEWLLHGEECYFNLGDPVALAWLQDHLTSVIQKAKIDWYREDFNTGGPYEEWRKNDEVEKEKTGLSRTGLTENFYIQGHLALWDSLRERNPGLLIDSCAAGGRRNDFESMRRAVPLLRSDYEMTQDADKFEGFQGHTYGLSLWLPFYGGLSRFQEPYEYRSLLQPQFGMHAAPLPVAKKAYDEFRTAAPHMIEGDYYPLTPYNRSPDQWIAWQFHTPGTGRGVIQAFRRAESGEAALSVQLRGLDPSARYMVCNLDETQSREASGADLMSGQFALELAAPRSAGVWEYSPAEKRP